MIRRIKSFGDSSKNVLVQHFPSIDKKNYLLFSLLALHYHNDNSQIVAVLRTFYENGFLVESDLVDFKKYMQYYSNAIVSPSKQLTNQDNDYIYLEKLGQGGYGTVYKVMHRIDQQIYALKEIKLHSPEAFQEIQTMAKLHHPCIVRYHHSFLREDQTLCIQMEYCPSSLRNWLKDPQRKDLESILSNLIKGVTYLHEQGYIHFDLKPDNILFDQHHQMKLCDFGFSKLFSPHLEDSSLACNIYTPSDATMIDFDIDWYAVCIIIIQAFLPPFITEMEKILTIQKIVHEKNFLFTVQDLWLQDQINLLFARIF